MCFSLTRFSALARDLSGLEIDLVIGGSDEKNVFASEPTSADSADHIYFECFTPQKVSKTVDEFRKPSIKRQRNPRLPAFPPATQRPRRHRFGSSGDETEAAGFASSPRRRQFGRHTASATDIHEVPKAGPHGQSNPHKQQRRISSWKKAVLGGSSFPAFTCGFVECRFVPQFYLLVLHFAERFLSLLAPFFKRRLFWTRPRC